MKNKYKRLNDIELGRELASRIHVIWSDWMTSLFSKSKKNADGSVTLPKDRVERWERQIKTIYDDLSPEEQQLDLEQVEKIIESLVTVDNALDEVSKLRNWRMLEHINEELKTYITD